MTFCSIICLNCNGQTCNNAAKVNILLNDDDDDDSTIEASSRVAEESPELDEWFLAPLFASIAVGKHATTSPKSTFCLTTMMVMMMIRLSKHHLGGWRIFRTRWVFRGGTLWTRTIETKKNINIKNGPPLIVIFYNKKKYLRNKFHVCKL